MVDLEVLLTSCSDFLGPCRQLDQRDGNSGERHYLGIFFTLQVACFGSSAITQDWYTATTVQLG